jgi:hypothetical protein
MEKLKQLKQHVIDLLQESSTWRSLMFFAALATGHQMDWPEEQQLFVATSAAYAIGLMFKDKTK